MLHDLMHRTVTRAFALTSFACISCMAATSLGCGSGVDAVAVNNRTFYAGYAGAAGGAEGKPIEAPVERLNRRIEEVRETGTAYKGVAVLEGNVRLAKPVNWVIRAADTRPGARYVQYLSPQQYLFAVYERPEDGAAETWADLLHRYEDAVKATGTEIIGGRVPMATWNAQGRAYTLKRGIIAAKAPYTNFTREYLLRGSKKIVLVQIVHQPDVLPELSRELMHVLASIEVD